MDSHSMLDHHYNISKRYNLINKCLTLMKDSPIDSVERIRIESMLIRMKIHLLDTPPHQTPPKGAVGDEEFERLLCLIQTISNGISHRGAVSEVLRHVTGVLSSLDRAEGGSA